MRNVETSTRGLCAWIATAALALLVAGPALAASGSGKSHLEAKNAATMTLQLDDLVVEVTDDTRIYSADNKRISFAQIPDPRRVPTTVEYRGRFEGTTMVADKLVVYITPQ